VISEVTDERGAIIVDSDGNALGADDLSLEARRGIAEVWVTQTLKTPQSNEELAGAPITLRGPDNTLTFRLLSPSREVVLSDHPSFACEKLAGASGYRVAIGDLKGREERRIVGRPDKVDCAPGVKAWRGLHVGSRG
jgi:hypothetical protein